MPPGVVTQAEGRLPRRAAFRTVDAVVPRRRATAPVERVGALECSIPPLSEAPPSPITACPGASLGLAAPQILTVQLGIDEKHLIRRMPGQASHGLHGHAFAKPRGDRSEPEAMRAKRDADSRAEALKDLLYTPAIQRAPELIDEQMIRLRVQLWTAPGDVLRHDPGRTIPHRDHSRLPRLGVSDHDRTVSYIVHG